MSTTRERILDASATLMRRQGYEATGIKEIVTAARAPFGSLYHFFPGGKEQLGAETVRRSGARYAELLPAVLGSFDDLETAVRAFFSLAADHLVESDFEDACPIATVALEASSRSEPIRQACAQVFADWTAQGSALLAARGVPEPSARRLVTEMLAGLEGAFVLCRAARDTEALAVVGEAAVRALRAAMTDAPT